MRRMPAHESHPLLHCPKVLLGSKIRIGFCTFCESFEQIVGKSSFCQCHFCSGIVRKIKQFLCQNTWNFWHLLLQNFRKASVFQCCWHSVFRLWQYVFIHCIHFANGLFATANFQLPTEGLFDKVQFVELEKDEAQALVEQYNREGKQASSSGGRNYRGNDRNQSYDNRSNRSYGSYSKQHAHSKLKPVQLNHFLN